MRGFNFVPIRSNPMLIFLSGNRRLDSGHNSIRLFFADFRKGFDLVDHNVILNELTNLNVHPVLTRWIKAFLTSRQQCVKIDCYKSSWKSANGGLPQGTCLGPLLFAILVNPLLLKDWNGRLKSVDDTTALEVVPRCSPRVTSLVVDDISHFSSTRGMELNPQKCKEMIINFLQYRIPCDQPMFINGQCVERVHSFKLLGVHLSDDLTWNTDVNHILKKANSRLFALRLLKKASIAQLFAPFLNMHPQYGQLSLTIYPFILNRSKREHLRLYSLTYPIMKHCRPQT